MKTKTYLGATFIEDDLHIQNWSKLLYRIKKNGKIY